MRKGAFRGIASESAGPPKKKYCPVKNNRSKTQQEMVSKQLLREAATFVSEAKYLLLQNNNDIPSLRTVHDIGRERVKTRRD